MNLNNLFLEYCKDKNFEINQNQLDIIDDLNNYYTVNFKQNFITKIFKKKVTKLGFYLMGDVGVGKTMMLNFFFDRFFFGNYDSPITNAKRFSLMKTENSYITKST